MKHFCTHNVSKNIIQITILAYLSKFVRFLNSIFEVSWAKHRQYIFNDTIILNKLQLSYVFLYLFDFLDSYSVIAFTVVYVYLLLREGTTLVFGNIHPCQPSVVVLSRNISLNEPTKVFFITERAHVFWKTITNFYKKVVGWQILCEFDQKKTKVGPDCNY